MCDEDEDYDLEYSEDSNSEPDVDLENQYYNSKALKEEDPKAALESFQRVLDLENAEKGEWGFKALKQMIKINFRLQNFDEMMRRYKQLLTYIKSAVTRNHSEKSINSILDYISTSKQMELLQVTNFNLFISGLILIWAGFDRYDILLPCTIYVFYVGNFLLGLAFIVV